MKLDIVFLPGDGIGPEVSREAIRVLNAVCERAGHELAVTEHAIGGAALDSLGEPLSDEAVADCQAAGAVLLGAVGGPQWDDREPRPEAGLFKLRKALKVFANLRPVKPHRVTRAQSPLKPELLEGVDILFVRELTGGIYFGEKHRTADRASDLCVYTRDEIERIVRKAAELAAGRRGKLTSVDKANVLETSRLWRDVTTGIVEAEFPQLELEHLLVDAAAMHLLSRPRDFDVIVTENMFGDILTDEASMLAGSMGLLPSASLAAEGPGLYEPIHGSAPDIAGRKKANPFAMILSVAMMLRHSFGLDAEAQAVEQAVDRCLSEGRTTGDLGGTLDTEAAADAVIAELRARPAA